MIESTPDGWMRTTVGVACSIRNDLRLPISRGVRSGMSGIYPYYGPTGVLGRISEYRLDGTFALIGEDGDHFLDVINKPQTILVSGQFNVNNHAHVIASTDVCGAEWFYNYFRHRSLTEYLTRQGAGRYKLNKAALERLTILLPPVAEQDAINHICREWASAIEKTERLIAAKERHYTYELARLIHFVERPLKASFSEILSESRESATCVDKHRLLSVRLYCKGVERREPRNQINEEVGTQYFIRRSGQIIYGKQNIFRGAIGLVPKELDGYQSSQDLPAFDVSEKFDPRWIYYYLSRPSFYRRLEALSAGSGSKRLHSEELYKLHDQFPRLEIQSKSADAIELMLREIALERRRLDLLKKQKRGLMQKLLTGQWRVKIKDQEVA